MHQPCEPGKVGADPQVLTIDRDVSRVTGTIQSSRPVQEILRHWRCHCTAERPVAGVAQASVD